MKRIFATVVIAIACAAGCGGGSGEACTTFGGTCPKGGTLSACCTDRQCHYKASDGSDFPCAMTDCTQANMQANAWCQSH
jgi:hypothetical protein